MKTKSLIIAALALCAAAQLNAQSTAFTYQGRLTDGTNTPTGNYDLAFTLYDASGGGNVVAGPTTNSGVGLNNGLFTTTLDFGAMAFTGAGRWLEISVRSNGIGSFTGLAPRQSLTPTPYAINAANLMSLANAPLDIKVNGQRALRLEPTIDAPNLIGGAGGNFITPGIYGAVIGGGGFGGNTNKVEANSGTISGGAGNNVRAAGGFIGGGFYNTIGLNSFDAVISGGYFSQIGDTAYQSTIAGGRQNVVSNSAQYATISGGIANGVGANEATVSGGGFNKALGFSSTVGGGGGNSASGAWSIIGGGRDNILTASDYTTIGGGRQNNVQSNAPYATIGGGVANVAGTNEATVSGGGSNKALGFSSTIGGGGGNSVSGQWSVIDGGRDNVIALNSDHAGIAGGRQNAVNTNNPYASVGGGYLNRIEAFSFFSVINGGLQNALTNSDSAMIGGGRYNSMIDSGATVIGGGQSNRAVTAAASALGGGFSNTISGANYAVVGGGFRNGVETHSHTAVIGGGERNVIHAQAPHGVIAGGIGNEIGPEGYWSTIGGGVGNTMPGFLFAGLNAGRASVIAGGDNNIVYPGSFGAVIAGGANHIVGSNTIYAVIAGGYSNQASGSFSFAAGRGAGANHDGAFVWADSQEAAFSSTASNQFLIRAGGGVGINTNNPSDVGLMVRSTSAPYSYGIEHTDGSRRLSTYVDPNGGWFGTVSAHPLNLYVNNGGQAVTIDLSERMGIGRAPTANKLEVEGEASKTTAGSWLANSDARIKKDIEPVSGALEKLARVRLVSFRYTDEYRSHHSSVEDRRYLNVIAQDFGEVFPDHIKSSGEKLPNGEEILQVDTYPLTIYSAAAIQELNRELRRRDAENVELKRELAELKENLKAINARLNGDVRSSRE